MGRHHTVVHKYMTPERAGYGTDRLDDADLRMIASRIILQAVEDWVFLLKLEDLEKQRRDPETLRNSRNCKAASANYNEIRSFLRSPWGETLCGMIDLEAGVVLEKLEGWLNDYRTKGVIALPSFQEVSGRRKKPNV